MGRDGGAPVIAPVTHDRRPKVTPGPKYVVFVAAIRSLLCFPNLTRAGVDCEPMSVAMAHCENGGLETRSTHKRVVLGDCAVIPQSHGLAGIVVRVLRAPHFGRSRSADAHVEHSV